MAAIKRGTFIALIIAVFACAAAIAFSHQIPSSTSEEPPPRITLPILMYHKINTDPESGGPGTRVSPEEFKWQMDFLKANGFETIGLAQILDYRREGKPLPPRPVIITFDDGYRDNYEIAFPILRQHGYKATLFIVTGAIGGTNSFDTEAGLAPENKMLTWVQIRKLSANGFEIGSHTQNHTALTGIPQKRVREELLVSKRTLEKGLGEKVEFFSYPWGKVDPACVEEVRKAGYQAAVTTDQGWAEMGSDLLLLKRLRVTGYLSHKEFAALLELPSKQAKTSP